MKLLRLRLNQRGVAHHFLLAVVVVGTAIGGSYYLLKSHADTNTGANIVSVDSSKCLDVRGGATANLTPVQIYTCLGSDSSHANQQWSVNPDGTIRSTASGKCLDVQNNNMANGAVVDIYTCLGNASNHLNQKWSVNPDGTIRSMATNKCLDVKNYSTLNTTPLQMYTCLGNAPSHNNQKWLVRGFAAVTAPNAVATATCAISGMPPSSSTVPSDPVLTITNTGAVGFVPTVTLSTGLTDGQGHGQGGSAPETFGNIKAGTSASYHLNKYFGTGGSWYSNISESIDASSTTPSFDCSATTKAS